MKHIDKRAKYEDCLGILQQVKKYTGLCYMAVVLIAISCNSEWDDHYDRNETLPQENLMQLVGKDAQLSKFTRLLEATGLDSLLSSEQSYTVWAPLDEVVDETVLTDAASMERFVKNHIARYVNPSSSEPSKKIFMLNGKPMSYGSDGTYNGIAIAESDLLAKNGVLHKIAAELPYKYNILEYLETHAEYSEAYTFISRFVEPVYDASLSTTYDSVFVDYNMLLADKIYGIGMIGSEDSLYTMIVPDNDAWNAAYFRISPYFKAYSKDEAVADSIQRVQTSLAILSGLTFRGNIENPSELDSIVTVTGNVIRPVTDYFNGYDVLDASNGIIYKADGILNFNDTCVWNHPICVEAEDMDYRINLSGTNSYIRTTDINSLVTGISNSSYLEVSSGNVDGGVIFDIPNTLSGKYDVYVDFVSPVVDGEALAAEMSKVVFQLRYMNKNGRQTTRNNNTATVIGGSENTGIISVKAYSSVELPVSDYYDAMWYLVDGNLQSNISETTTLQVKTKVSSSDAKKGYLRKFRVDRVRFVPVMDTVE